MNKVKYLIPTLFIIFFFIAISFPTFGAASDSLKFEKFKKDFVLTYWEIYPSDAIYNGYFKNENKLYVQDSSFRKFQKSKLNELKKSLNIFNKTLLSASQQIDFKMISDRLESGLWYLTEYREYEWNPAYYNVGGEMVQILNSQHKNLEQRLNSILSRLKNVELYYKAAKENIKVPVIEHTDLAILQSKGSLYIFENLIPDSVAASKLSSQEKQSLLEANQIAIESLMSYIEFLTKLKSGLTIENSRSFHLGKDLYEKKFEHDLQSGFKATEVYELALERKKEIEIKMAEIARNLWPSYFKNETMPDTDHEIIRRVLTEISQNHVAPGDFLTTIEKQIPVLAKFVSEKNLLYIDPAKPLVVRKTPGFMEGSGAGASISAPGPYNKQDNTYYNVSPLDGYTPEKAESFLREYNNFTLQILNIHEAIPGHYTQLVYANQSANSIYTILGNGAMVEGWAVYSERMMMEEGYGNNQPELWLMYYKWHLRSVCNTILDYSVHVLNWPEKVAMKFLTTDAFQEPAEAEGKWIRSRLTQVQLCSYFTGYAEIYELRNQIKQKQGAAFDLKNFHEQFLSYGSAPVKYISLQMQK